jgi:hypothetical protein
VKNFVIGLSLVAVGAWYVHHTANYSRSSRAPESVEKQSGEMVIANAPDGSLQERWPRATPTATMAR